MTDPHGPEPLASTLDAIAGRVLDGTSADIALVCLRHDDGVYRIEAHAGDFPVEVAPALEFRIGEGGVGSRTATSGVPMLIDDYRRDVPESPHLAASRTVGARSIVTAPVGASGDVVAVIYLMSRTPDCLTDRDLERVAAQARIAEIAIRRALA